MNCPNCNKPIEAGAAFCGNCGYALQAAPQSVVLQAPPAQVIAPTIAPVQQAVTPPSPPVAPSVAPAPVTPPASAAPQPAPITPAPSPIAQVYGNQPAATPQPVTPFVAAPVMGGGVPSYAVANPATHAGETKALLSVIFGVISILLGIIPIVGIIFSIVGIVLGTMSHSSAKRTLSTVGIVLSCLGIVVSVAVFAFVLTHEDKLSNSKKTDSALNGTASTAASASTPCYEVDFSTKLNIKNTSGSCDMSAFDGATIDESSDAYKIYATKSSTLNADNFQTFAKQAIDQDVASNLAGFTITNVQTGTFAGSQAYTVTTVEKSSGVSVVEAAVLHPVSNGNNVFVFAHAVQDKTADLKTLEAGWQWK